MLIKYQIEQKKPSLYLNIHVLQLMFLYSSSVVSLYLDVFRIIKYSHKRLISTFTRVLFKNFYVLMFLNANTHVF